MATLFLSHTRVRSVPPCGSYILVLIIYRSLHAGKLNARTAQVRSPLEVFLERGRWGCWCVGVICSLESVLCPTASPFFLSASLPSPLDCVRRSAKAETQRGGGGGDAAAAAADALAHVWQNRLQHKSRHLANPLSLSLSPSCFIGPSDNAPSLPSLSRTYSRFCSTAPGDAGEPGMQQRWESLCGDRRANKPGLSAIISNTPLP